ncbi:hypothetical protein ACIGW8_20105 [Streptomyces sioyaensis]|uniref:hypothetical protein n=1 Tax=Streptomyces sioyaensis TaxID=67364 RepID=UPI0037D2CFD4
MPTRTTLPPNLTRHFYETRRAFLQSAGQDTTPWFQLSPVERTVVESEMEIFRQAIRRAEEEQDLLSSLDATRAAAAEPAVEDPEEPAAAEDAPEDCACPGCSAVAAFLKLIGAPTERLETTLGRDLSSDGKGVTAVSFRTVPLDTRPWAVPVSEEEKTRLQEAAKDKVTTFLMTAGVDLDVLDGTAPNGPFTFDARPISIDALFRKPSPFAGIRRESWQQTPPTADKV